MVLSWSFVARSRVCVPSELRQYGSLKACTKSVSPSLCHSSNNPAPTNMAASMAFNLDFSRYSVILVVIIFVCYINSLQCGFVFDDLSAIIDNQDLRPHVPLSNLFWNDFWGTPMNKEDSHKSYRPLCVLTFRLNYALTALNPMSYHLVNIVLHAVVSVLLMRVCCLFLHHFTALLAAVLFALHPIHTEAVTGVVGRAESLSACFFLAALLVYAKASKHPSRTNWWFLLLTLLFVVAAMLSKEQDNATGYSQGLCQYLQRQNLFPSLVENFSFARNFLSWFHVVPIAGQDKDYGCRTPGVHKFVAFALTKQGPRARAIIMSLTLLVLPFVPASNLFFPVGFVVAERVLYTPSMGFCILVALGFELLIQHTNKTLKMVLWGLMVFLLTVHGLKTIIRNFDWQSEYILFKSAVKVNQRNAKLFNNIGHALEKTSNWSEALEYFTFAAKVQPDDIGAHINVGRTYQHLNMSKEAEKAFQTAIDLFPPVIQGKSYTARVAPSHLNAFLNLASLISKNESRLKEAEKLYKSAITMRADYVKAYMSRGEVLVRLGRLEEAKEQYRIALHYEQSDADIYYNVITH
ncbi:and TPR repeat-containing 3 [Octopus vulgaris]|uniref:And TPR repeat-containing 3 n=1 Tax=Octopus vulgaris TaxID=6645 RepID=A0AA36FLB4_OCTVU|nr:and TPR repeat-containing 3 [Octopus vulgaris]